MQNFISTKFLDHLEPMFASNADKFLSGEANGLITLFRLLNALPLNTDIAEEEVRRVATTSAGSKEFSTFKERILFNAVKNQSLKLCDIENLDQGIKNYNSYYLLDKMDTEKISRSNGIVCKGLDYNGDTFYEDCTITDLWVTGNWKKVFSHTPPVNSLLIIDRYIFGYPFDLKLDNLI